MKKTVLFFTTINFILNAESTFDPDNYIEREINAVRLDQPLQIDGDLSEALYRTPSIQTFIQIDPDNGKLATEKTELWVGYDDEALYIGARLWDSQPDSIVGRMGRRDVNTNSDEFQLGIDSYYDKRSGYFFVINPAGTIMDGTISNDSWADETWDGIWDGKSTIDSQGWKMEMRIPFSQIRFNKQDEYVWGIGLGRKIQRKNEQSFCTYYPRGENRLVSRFATLRGINNISPPKRVEFTPYFTSGYSALPSEQDNPFYKGSDSNMGVGTDIKLGIGSNLTIDATINPDFGQVEVDPSTINLSAYETYYQEKRPFFVEGANIFSFGTGGPTNRWGFNFMEPDFFYSRRIGRQPQKWPNTDGWVDMPSATTILGAAKISGKLPGNWSIGGLSAVTKREYARVDEDSLKWKEEAEPLTYYSLFRSQKEFNDGLQGFGFLGTYVARDFDNPELRDEVNKQAVGGGIDGWLFTNSEKDWVIAGWFGFSNVSGNTTRLLSLQENSSHYFQRPDQDHVAIDTTVTSMTGYAGRLMVNKETGHWTFNTALGIITPEFESNDMGLAFGTDRINKHLVLGYKWYDPGEIFRYADINVAYMSNHNFGGTKINERIFLFSYVQFLNYWSINSFSGWSPVTLSDRHLRGGPMVESPAGSFINFNINSDQRKTITYGLGGFTSQSSGGNHSWSSWCWIEFQIGTQLSFSISPEYSNAVNVAQYVDYFEDESAITMYGKRYILAEINQKTFSSDIRIDYTFSPMLSLQVYLQPFIATGKYSSFKEFIKPESYDFFEYEEGSTLEITEDGYDLYPYGINNGDPFYIGNPDFNYKALVGNAVLRWEFKPGSILYLVWTRNGSDSSDPGSFKFRRDIKDLLNATTDNIFAVKLTYWIG